jgi:hypothetical protein
MRVFFWSVAGFVAGTIASYVAAMVGYSVYGSLFRVHDHDGGGAMAMGLIIGPVLALLCGLVTAIICGLRAAQLR